MKQIEYSLMYVTDERITNDIQFLTVLEASLKGGVSIVQLREKKLDTKKLYHRAIAVKHLCETYNTPLIINDRVDIALAINADGVHIGQNDLPVVVARKLLGKDRLIGLSVSNEKQALEANKLKIDYIGLSPIFSTKTKTEDLDKPLGIEGLKKLKKISNYPIICIGGITTENATSIMQNNAEGIAVISAISQAKNPKQATLKLKETICQTGTKK